MERVFGDDFVLALPCHRHRAHLAETAQSVIVIRLLRQQQHFERAPQVHVQAAFFRLAIERGGAVDDRIRGVNQAVIVVVGEAEVRRGQVAAKNPHTRLEVFVEAREIQMQLQGLPQAAGSLLRVAGAHQQVQRSAVLLQQVGGHVRADVSGGTSQEYRHVAPLVPVLTTSPFSGTAAGCCRLRAGRASSGRPSIRG